jgi:type I restriction enzyme R subunit
MIIDHLTEHGALDARLLYDSPFTDLNPKGVDGLFQSRQVDEIISILDKVRQRAVA